MEANQENKTSVKIDFSFKKEEKLCSKKIIDQLFSEGEAFLVFPLKFIFLKTKLPSNKPVQTAFTVGKKNFKRAVHRNRIKRLMREAFRLNKHTLYADVCGFEIAIFILFIGKEMPGFEALKVATEKGLARLSKQINSSK